MKNIYELNGRLTYVDRLINKSYLRTITKGEIEFNQDLKDELKVLLSPLLMTAKALFYTNNEDLDSNSKLETVAVYNKGILTAAHSRSFRLTAERVTDSEMTKYKAVKISNLISKMPLFSHSTYSTNETDYVREHPFTVDDLIKSFYKFGSKLTPGAFHANYEESNDFCCIVGTGEELVKLTFSVDKLDFDVHFNNV